MTDEEMKPDTDGFRTCSFCKCRTNAALRACCDAGRNSDLLRIERRQLSALEVRYIELRRVAGWVELWLRDVNPEMAKLLRAAIGK